MYICRGLELGNNFFYRLSRLFTRLIVAGHVDFTPSRCINELCIGIYCHDGKGSTYTNQLKSHRSSNSYVL